MRLPLSAALLLAATPALADAVTYKGTLGKLPIIVEFTSEPEAVEETPFNGRYAYVNKGIDIPLDSVTLSPGKLELAEELPCTQTSCLPTENGSQPTPRLGAKWQLTTNEDGSRIEGTWSNAGKTLPVALDRIGSRPLDNQELGTAQDLTTYLLDFIVGQADLTAETAPYDWAKMQIPFDVLPEAGWGNGLAVQYTTDPRTKFAYPRLVSTGSIDVGTANAFLERRHFAMGTDALNCSARQYLGMGWFEMDAFSVGGLGGYDDELIEVTYVSPTVMSWTESGSLYCGGAHPWNHSVVTNLDMATGEPLDLSRVFSAWVPQGADLEIARQSPRDYVWSPTQELADFVRSHRIKDADPSFEADCAIDELVGEYLSIRFVQGDRVVFGLGGLPNVIQACAHDLYQAPIGELRAFLAPEAKDYFPSLGS